MSKHDSVLAKLGLDATYISGIERGLRKAVHRGRARHSVRAVRVVSRCGAQGKLPRPTFALLVFFCG